MFSSDFKMLGAFLMQEGPFGHVLISCFSAMSLTEGITEKQTGFCSTTQ